MSQQRDTPYLAPPEHPLPPGPPQSLQPQHDRLNPREQERSSYLKMLTNIANDLDLLLTDLCHVQPGGPGGEEGDGTGVEGEGEGEQTLHTLTLHSGDTLGKDSFLSSAENASRRLGDTTGSSQSLMSSSSDNLSADSGHDERTQGTVSPLVFDPNHFGSKPKIQETSTMTSPMASQGAGSRDNLSASSGDLRPISLVERLAKTHCIWLLTQMSRAGAVHLLKDRETGVFLIRKSSQTKSLALSVQNRLSDRANVDHYLIEASHYGMRLQGSAHFFHSIPSLIAHYIDNLDELPYRLTLPVAILQARSSRELASLAMLGQDFWLSPVSRNPRSASPALGALHKSCSEPIDIRQPQHHGGPTPTSLLRLHPATTTNTNTNTTPLPLHPTPSASQSVSDFSDFVTSQQLQAEQELAFKDHHHRQTRQTDAVPSPSRGNSPRPNPRTVFASASAGSRAPAAFGPHLLRLKGHNDTPTTSTDSSGEEGGGGGGGGGVPHIQLVGASPQSQCAMSNASSQTDFSSLSRHEPKGKPNLYSMTPLELLNLPADADSDSNSNNGNNATYFRSNLSDKMSDYEDIWRSSYYDTDSVKNGSVKGGDKSGGGGGGGYDVGSCTTARSDFTKFFSVSQSNNNIPRDSNNYSAAVKPVTVMVTSDRGCQHHHIATQSDESPPIPPKNWRTSVTAVNPKLLHPHPVGRLSRLKSSSDSSLATVSSPVYAEPADAVVFHERHSPSRRSKTRRRSAPSVSSQAAIAHESRSSSRHHHNQLPPGRHHRDADNNNKLATILSSDAIDQQPKNTRFNFNHPDPQARKVGAADLKQRSGGGGGMTRSQSMRTPQDVARLSKKKPGWQERFNRLKLGTKVLIRSGSPYAATTGSAQPQLDTSLFSAEEDNSSTTGGPSLNRFPVYPRGGGGVAGVRPLNNRESYFSESSTVQDIISCAMPELMVRPIQTQQQLVVHAGKPPLSEYDNFNPYAPPSGASSRGTVFCSPWEGGVVDTLIRSSTTHLPPAMDLQERVQKWQEANHTFNQLHHHHNHHHQHHPQQPPPPPSSQPPPPSHPPPPQSQPVPAQPWHHPLQPHHRLQPHPHQDQQQKLQQHQQLLQQQLLQQQQQQQFQQHVQVSQTRTVQQQHTSTISTTTGNAGNTGNSFSSVAVNVSAGTSIRDVSHQQSALTSRSNNSNNSNAQQEQSTGLGLHHHKSPSSSQSQTRPVSMYQQHIRSPHHPHSSHAQLTRSLSNPSQPQQALQPKGQQAQLLNQSQSQSPRQLGQGHGQSHGQGQGQHQGQRHLQGQGHHHHQRVTEGSTAAVAVVVAPGGGTGTRPGGEGGGGGLSSNCPDVINCHHVAVDTGNNAALSDDEILVQSVHSTLQQRGKQGLRQKQVMQNPGSKIREYIYKLSQDHTTTFGSTIENFIQCTVDSQERTPHHVMRNVRQFMTGIKNYLVKHGEGQLEDLIERERNKLGTNEILNIDSLIETTLHLCVLRPLKHHIYRLFVDFHGRNNSLELMSRNIKYARTKSAEEIGIKPGLVPPQSGDMDTIKYHLDKMQRAYSPLKKLEHLLCATSAIYACVKVQGKQQIHSRGPASLGADDFLPLLIYVLVHCGLVSAEIEADYMWGLLHPSVLTGEGGYYLTTLSSAVLILKNFQEAHESKTASLEGQLPTLGEVQGFLKIAFPDELRDTILWKTLPVRPNMTTKDVCAMIAHKFKITNPQDYGLILLCTGEESQLTGNQCPQILKKDNLATGKESFFAYKRLGANIAWPSSMKHS